MKRKRKTNSHIFSKIIGDSLFLQDTDIILFNILYSTDKMAWYTSEGNTTRIGSHSEEKRHTCFCLERICSILLTAVSHGYKVPMRME